MSSAAKTTPLPAEEEYLRSFLDEEARRGANANEVFERLLANQGSASRSALEASLADHREAASELEALRRRSSPSEDTDDGATERADAWQLAVPDHRAAVASIAKRWGLDLGSIRQSRGQADLRTLYDETFGADREPADFHEGENQVLEPPYTFALRGPVTATRSDEPSPPFARPLVSSEGALGGTSVARVSGADNSDHVFIKMEPLIAQAVEVAANGTLSIRVFIDPMGPSMTGSTRDEWGFSDVQVLQRMTFGFRAHLRDASGEFFVTTTSTFSPMEFFTRSEDVTWAAVTPAPVPTGLVRLGQVRSGDRIFVEVNTEIVNTFNCNDVTVFATNAQGWRVRQIGLRIDR